MSIFNFPERTEIDRLALFGETSSKSKPVQPINSANRKAGGGDGMKTFLLGMLAGLLGFMFGASATMSLILLFVKWHCRVWR